MAHARREEDAYELHLADRKPHCRSNHRIGRVVADAADHAHDLARRAEDGHARAQRLVMAEEVAHRRVVEDDRQGLARGVLRGVEGASAHEVQPAASTKPAVAAW